MKTAAEGGSGFEVVAVFIRNLGNRTNEEEGWLTRGMRL